MLLDKPSSNIRWKIRERQRREGRPAHAGSLVHAFAATPAHELMKRPAALVVEPIEQTRSNRRLAERQSGEPVRDIDLRGTHPCAAGDGHGSIAPQQTARVTRALGLDTGVMLDKRGFRGRVIDRDPPRPGEERRL